MKFKCLGTCLYLSIAASTAFAVNSKEIINLIHQPKISLHKLPLVQSNHTTLNWESLHGPILGEQLTVVTLKQNPLLIFTFYKYGVHKSKDGGQTWEKIALPKNKGINEGVNKGINENISEGINEGINDFAAIDDNHLLLAVDNRLYASLDQGKTWELATRKDKAINKLFVLNPNLILMNTNHMLKSEKEGIYRSIDGGKSWQPARLGLNDEYGFWSMSGNDNLLFVMAKGLYISTNGGKLWTQPANTWSDFFAYEVVVNANNDVFIAAGNEIYKTDPLGRTLENVKDNIPGYVRFIALDKQNNLYVVSQDYINKPSEDYLYQSKDNGKNWQRLYAYTRINNFTLLDDGSIIMNTNQGLIKTDANQKNPIKLSLDYSKSETTQIFASDAKHIFALDSVLSRSDDAGKTWSIVRDPLIGIADATIFQNKILTLEWDKNETDQHIFSSSDQGQTWQSIYDYVSIDNSSCFQFSLQNSALNSALIVPCSTYTLFTRDLVHWTKINKSTNGSFYNPYYFDGNSIYYSDGNVIQCSKDEGKTWTTLLDDLHASSPRLAGYRNIILIALRNAGIIKISNDAQEWDLLSTGISDFHFTQIVAIDEMNYIVSTDNGVFYTDNGGKYWRTENQGLDNYDVASLFANKSFALIGTRGSGVYYSSLL